MRVVLVEPENPANVGFVARVMKNFGFKELVLVRPKADLEEAKITAKHAKDILENAEIVDEIPKAPLVVGTTGKRAKPRLVRRIYVTPRELKEYLREDAIILFGRESIGLTNEELELCDIVVSIPTSREYPIMNLSHAVAVVLYEISDVRLPRNLADAKLVDAIIRMANEIADLVGATKSKQVLSKLIKRVNLRKREASLLAGFFSKTLAILKARS